MMQAQEQVPFEPLPWSREGLALKAGPPPVEPRVEPTGPPPEASPTPAELPALAIFSAETEDLLQSYFARDGEFTEPSNFAAMCERALRLSHASFPCPKCGSSGSSPHTPEEFAARATRIEAARLDAVARLELAQPKERDEISAELAAARRALEKELRAEAACQLCKGSGWTTPRKFGRGHGDAISTTVWCPTCAGGGLVGRPEPWQVARLVADLEEVPGVDIQQIVAAARAMGAQLPREGRWPRWPRAVALLRKMAWKAAAAAAEAARDHESTFSVMPTFDRRSALRQLIAVMGDPCDRCEGGNGSGYVVPIDVRETGSSIAPESGCADPIDIIQHGELDRILAYVRDENVLAAAVLARYYGIDGNRWGATPRQRIWAIMPLTKPCRVLAREAGDRFEREHGIRLDDCELLAREQDEDRKSALVNHRRRAMLDSGDKAARNLLEAAKRAWTRAVVESGHDASDSIRVQGYEAELDDRLEANSRERLAVECGRAANVPPLLSKQRDDDEAA